MITIRHTLETGTLVYGTAKGDGAGKLLGNGFRTSKNLPVDAELGDPYWHVPHSRDRRADRWLIEGATRRLREAGFSVDVQIDNVTLPGTDFAARENERYERAADRANKFTNKTHKARGSAGAIREKNRRTYEALAGTPILIGHHSENRHRNLLDRLDRRERKAFELMDRGDYYASRAHAAARYKDHREDIPATLRRIDRLQADERRILRSLEGEEEWWEIEVTADWTPDYGKSLEARLADRPGAEVIKRDEIRNRVLVHLPVSETYRAEMTSQLVILRGELAYWRDRVDEAEASGVKVWRTTDFKKGDFVAAGGDRWYEVVRVNPKSVSVPALFDGAAGQVRTMAAAQGRYRGHSSTHPLSFDQVTGRMTGEETRRRFPAAFTRRNDEPPPRPAKKRGRVKLRHSPGAVRETWYFTIAGRDYHASWPHPPEWWSGQGRPEPCTDVQPVHVFARSGRTSEPTTQIPVDGPIRYVEEVHNLVRAWVETFAAQQRHQP